MGEYAEMMLDGTMCAQCGVYIGRDNGFPEYCGNCQKENHRDENPVRCTFKGCKKRFKTPEAAAQHSKDKHGGKP